MKKAKKTKTLQRRTELDQIVTQLRMMQRRETKNIIEIGRLLVKSRELLANEHGKWQPWLEKNFDRDYRTAIRYVSAAEYVERKSKSDTVSVFANLAPTVLYQLARGQYNEQEEAAILAATRKGRVDQDAAYAICEALAPPNSEESDEPDDADEAVEVAEDPESAALLDGPPPPLQPTESLPLTNFALRDFDQAISALKKLMTKPAARFTSTTHNTNDLEHVESFIHAVADRVREASARVAPTAPKPRVQSGPHGTTISPLKQGD